MSALSKALRYDDDIEQALGRLETLLAGSYNISKRTIGLMLLRGDREVGEMVKRHDPGAYGQIKAVVAGFRAGFNQPVGYVVSQHLQREANRILSRVVTARA